jgi:hypothetical protein
VVIEEALYLHLSTEASVALLASTRGYPLTIPQDVSLPAWAYQRIAGDRVLAHDGVVRYARALIQITAQGPTYNEAKDLMNAIRQALDGFTGQMGSGGAPGNGGVWVFRTLGRGEIDGYGTASPVFTVRMDFEIEYRE